MSKFLSMNLILHFRTFRHFNKMPNERLQCILLLVPFTELLTAFSIIYWSVHYLTKELEKFNKKKRNYSLIQTPLGSEMKKTQFFLIFFLIQTQNIPWPNHVANEEIIFNKMKFFHKDATKPPTQTKSFFQPPLLTLP